MEGWGVKKTKKGGKTGKENQVRHIDDERLTGAGHEKSKVKVLGKKKKEKKNKVDGAGTMWGKKTSATGGSVTRRGFSNGAGPSKEAVAEEAWAIGRPTWGRGGVCHKKTG